MSYGVVRFMMINHVSSSNIDDSCDVLLRRLLFAFTEIIGGFSNSSEMKTSTPPSRWSVLSLNSRIPQVGVSR